MSREIIGKCTICGKYGELTFEHIPPKKAMNNHEARYITGDEFTKLVTSKNRLPWETEGLHYEKLQKGYGKWSLCRGCNNLTGTLYGNEYCKIANDFAWFLEKNSSAVKKSNTLHTKIKEFYPLRFIKQVLSMFCSVSGELSSQDNEIRQALLNKNKKIVNPKFKIYMFIIKNRQISWKGTSAMLKDNEIITVSELIAYPFGFIFDHNGNCRDGNLLDITSFLQHDYEEETIMEMEVAMLERNMLFPLDFRTKEEVLELIKKNNE